MSVLSVKSTNMDDEVQIVSAVSLNSEQGLKRPSGANGEAAPPRKRVDNSRRYTKEVIRIPQACIAHLIGHNGKEVDKIRQESGCKNIDVTLDLYGGSKGTRPVNLQGRLESVVRAKKLIQEFIGEWEENNNRNRGGRGRSGAGGGTVEILRVPSEQVGMIIGKGGESIKFIERESGARCKIGEEDGFDCIINIFGTKEQIFYAKAIILKKVNEANQDFEERTYY